MVGRDYLQRARGEAGPKRILVVLVAEWRRHYAAGGIVPVLVEVLALVEGEVLHERFAIDALAEGAGAADRFVRGFAGDVDDVDRHPGGIGDHDGAVGRFTLHLGRARIGVAFRTGGAGAHEFLLETRYDVAVLGVNEGEGAELGAAQERLIHLVVVHHQRALVGHEVLEGIDAAVDDFRHLLPDLFAPPGHRHVEAVVGDRLAGFLVPGAERVERRLLLAGKDEVDHHGRPARDRRARAGRK